MSDPTLSRGLIAAVMRGLMVATVCLSSSAIGGTSGSVPGSVAAVVHDEYAEGTWYLYDRNNGLSNNSVMALNFDPGGVWFGTFGGGASRYDGQNWSTFSTTEGIAGNQIVSTRTDSRGDIWFGTIGMGASRYDGVQWTTYTTEDGLGSNDIYTIKSVESGDLWFGTIGGGATRYDGNTWTTFTNSNGLAHNTVYAIAEDSRGDILFGTLGGGISRFDGTSWTSITVKEGLISNDVQTILVEGEDDLWIGTRKGISHYKNKKWHSYTTRDGLAGDEVRAIYRDRQGVLWIATRGGGVSSFDGAAWRTYSAPRYLASNEVWAIGEDQSGCLWIGNGGGVSRFDREWKSYDAGSGIGQGRITSIAQDQEGTVWASTESGLSTFDGKNWITLTSKDGFAGNLVKDVTVTPAGDVWVSSFKDRLASRGGEVSRFDGSRWISFSTDDGLASDQVFTIFGDSSGVVWFGTEGEGLSRLDETGWQSFNEQDGLASDFVYSIAEQSGGIMWFGTTKGVSRYDGQGWRTYSEKDGLAGDLSWAILEDSNGILWFGTTQGLSRYDGNEWISFGKKDGLADDLVSSIIEDSDGNLWLGSPSGVSRYDGEVFQTLTVGDGLADIEVICLLQTQDGDFWFGTRNGLTRYSPGSIGNPTISLDALTFDRRYEGEVPLSLPENPGLMVFEFHGASLKTRPGGLLYKYRLTGVDDDWRTTRESRVEYLDVPRGDHRFEVMAMDRNMTYSLKPAVIDVSVHLPYERIGFYSIIGLLVLTLTWQASRLVRGGMRLRAANQELDHSNHALLISNSNLASANSELEKLNRLRNTLVAQIVHDLKNPVGANKLMARNMLESIGGDLSDKHVDYLNRMQNNNDRLTRFITNLLDLQSMMISPDQTTKSSMALNPIVQDVLNSYAPVAEDRGVNLSQDGANIPLRVLGDPDQVHRILANLVSNAIEHTPAAGSVSVRFETDSPFARISVIDTGEGITDEHLPLVFEPGFRADSSEKASKGIGLGLAIARELVNQHGGKISVKSIVGSGTTFDFTLPLSGTHSSP